MVTCNKSRDEPVPHQARGQLGAVYHKAARIDVCLVQEASDQIFMCARVPFAPANRPFPVAKAGLHTQL